MRPRRGGWTQCGCDHSSRRRLLCIVGLALCLLMSIVDVGFRWREGFRGQPPRAIASSCRIRCVALLLVLPLFFPPRRKQGQLLDEARRKKFLGSDGIQHGRSWLSRSLCVTFSARSTNGRSP